MLELSYPATMFYDSHIRFGKLDLIRVEEPVSPVRQSSSGGATNNPPFPKMLFKPARESRLLKLAYC